MCTRKKIKGKEIVCSVLFYKILKTFLACQLLLLLLLTQAIFPKAVS